MARTNFVWRGLAAILFLVLVMPADNTHASTPSSTLRQSGVLGAVDFDGYCRSLGNQGAALDGNTIYNWYCVTPSGNQATFSVTAACQWQYGRSDVIDRATDYNNPNSWQCVATSGPLGTVDFDGYCRSLGDQGASLDGATAYDWHCIDPSGTHVTFSATAACQWQYQRSDVIDVFRDFNDPHSWVCYVLGDGMPTPELLPPTATPAPAVPTPTPYPTPIPPSKPVIRRTTRVLSTSAMSHLQSSQSSPLNTAAPHLTLTFRRPGRMLKSLKPGDIIVAGVTPKTPYGMVRRVTTVHISGGREQVATVATSLASALPANYTYGNAGHPFQWSPCTPIPNSPVGGVAGISISGQVCPSLTIYVYATNQGHNEFSVMANVGGKADITVKFQQPLPGGVSRDVFKVPIISHTFPFIIPIAIDLSVKVSESGSLSGPLTIGGHIGFSGSLCATYDSTRGFTKGTGTDCSTPDGIKGQAWNPTIHFDQPSSSVTGSLEVDAGDDLSIGIGAAEAGQGILGGPDLFAGYYAAIDTIPCTGIVDPKVGWKATTGLSFDFLGWSYSPVSADLADNPVYAQDHLDAPCHLNASLVADNRQQGEAVIGLEWDSGSANEDGFRVYAQSGGLYGGPELSPQEVGPNSKSAEYQINVGGFQAFPAVVCFYVVAYKGSKESGRSNTAVVSANGGGSCTTVPPSLTPVPPQPTVTPVPPRPTITPLPPAQQPSRCPSESLVAVTNCYRIWTDRTSYTVGDTLQYCYAVPGPSQVEVVDGTPDGNSQVMLSGSDTGTGDCRTAQVTPPTGRECLTLNVEYQGHTYTDQTCFQVAGGGQVPTVTAVPTVTPVSGNPNHCNTAQDQAGTTWTLCVSYDASSDTIHATTSPTSPDQDISYIHAFGPGGGWIGSCPVPACNWKGSAAQLLSPGTYRIMLGSSDPSQGGLAEVDVQVP